MDAWTPHCVGPQTLRSKAHAVQLSWELPVGARLQKIDGIQKSSWGVEPSAALDH